MDIGLFYGSTTGNTEMVAEAIQQQLGADQLHLHNVVDEPLEKMQAYDFLILGIPTWDYGELQAEWADVWEEIDQQDLAGKTVALYGLGDQLGYSEWFLDAMGLLHDRVKARGAKMIGYWPVSGYDFEASKALTADQQQFVGLALDEDCQHELTEERLTRWITQIVDEYQPQNCR